MYWYINMYWYIYIYICVCTGIYRYIYVCMYTMCYLGATASRLNAICSFRVPQGPNLQHFRPTTSQLNTLNQSTSVLLPNYRSSTVRLPTYYIHQHTTYAAELLLAYSLHYKLHITNLDDTPHNIQTMFILILYVKIFIYVYIYVILN